MKKLGLILLLPLLGSLLAYASIDDAPIRSEAFKSLAPAKEYRATARDVVELLKKGHYLSIKLDDAFSTRLLNRYLEYLDASRSHFLASDIAEFTPYQHKLDEALLSGDLDPAFHIFNRFQERRIERTQYMLTQLEKGLDKIDFDANDELLIDRDAAAWLADIKQAQNLWQKQFKHDVLNLKLTEKPLDEIATLLNKRYVNQLNRILQTNSEDVFQVYLDAFTQLYDPHTRYLPPRESKNFDISMSLSLEGIGALLEKEDEYTKVVRLVTAGPAEKSKLLQPADRIVGVGQGKDGEMVDVIGWRLDDVVDLIRGPKGTVVRLNLLPNNSQEPREINITRDTVNLEDQAANKKMFTLSRDGKPYKVGVITLPLFYGDFKAARLGLPNYRSSSRDTARLIAELKQEENIDALILDLRNNGGGSLPEAQLLTGLFIRSGPIVQVRTSDNHIETLKDSDSRVIYDGPLAVLVNRLSASASEIVAGAIQDTGRGIVVGSQTFGKGTVQTINNLDPGELKYTQAKFYRISGGSTQHKGIIPDITYPEIYDTHEIGESAQDNALPWDQIRPAEYLSSVLSVPLLNELHSAHEKRAKDNADFLYLQKRIALLEEARQRKTITLNEKSRRQEKAELEARLLALENTRRQAKKEPLLKTYKELESAELEDDKDKIDALLTETGHVLHDMQTLKHSRLAKSNGQ